MNTPRSMPDLAALRARLRALPLDRAPLRRAGLLTALLVVLLVAGKALGPGQSAAGAPASRNGVQAVAEKDAAVPRGWTGGRVLAVLLLAAGAGGAWALHRRAAPTAARSSALDVLETHSLAPGQTLRLVACGDDVMLLSATAEAIRMLRHWPREQFDRGASSFADLLASAEADAPLADAVAEGDAAQTDTESWISRLAAVDATAQVAEAHNPAGPMPPETGRSESVLEHLGDSKEVLPLDRGRQRGWTGPTSEPIRRPPLTPPVQEGDSGLASIASLSEHRVGPTPPPAPSWPDVARPATGLSGIYESCPDAPEDTAPEAAAPALTSLQRLQARRSASVAPDLPAAPGALRQFQPADV